MDFTRRKMLKLLGLGTIGLGGGLGGMMQLSGCSQIATQSQAQTWSKGVCRFCGVGCGVMIGLRDGKVVEVKGDELAHNRGMLCVKGAMLASILNLSGRLEHPMIRRNGKLEAASWDEAMTRVAQSFQTT